MSLRDNLLETVEQRMSLRDSLLATVGRRRYAEHEIEGLGLVRVQSLTERERSEFERLADTKPEEARAFLITRALVDEEGRRLLSDTDVANVLEMDSAVTIAIGALVLRHSMPRALPIEDEIKN